MGRRQPGTSVAVFIDGWNLHRANERAFAHGPIHPLLLGRVLAGARALHSVDYYIGVPDPRVESENAAARSRQLEFMRKTGVRTHAKKLRYRWEWKVNKWELPHPGAHKGQTRSVEATSFNQGREKGVDVALALDAYAAAMRDDVDVVIIVSADSDLNLVPEMIDRLPQGTGARVENAVVNRHAEKSINRSFAWSHQIDASVFAAIRDDNDYYTKTPGKVRKRRVRAVVTTEPNPGGRDAPKDERRAPS